MPPTRASSPDPLQDLDGPSIYHGGTPIPRTLKRTTTTIISPRKNKKLSHTTVVSTPTRSPWRIRVVVEAERDSGGDSEEEEKEKGLAKRARTKTTKVPLRGLSPVPAVVTVEEKANARKKTTPARRRRRSTTATPGGPGKTPAKKRGKSGTPVEEEKEHIDEGIGPSEDGFGEEVELVPMVVVQTRPKATPRKTPAKRTPAKRTPAKPRTPAIASSSKAPPSLPPPQGLAPPTSPRSALSPVSSNRLSPTPSPRKRSPFKPRGFLASSNGSNDDDMEGFSMVDTNSLLPDFLNSLSHQQDPPAQGNMLDDDEEDLPDFTFVSHGTSYTPHAHKKHGLPPAEPEPLFEDDPVGAETFYGSSKPDFRSSPPALFRAKITPVPKPLVALPEPAKRKRRRSVPALVNAVAASEGLRSSMGLEETTMTGERFGGALEEDEYAELQEQESESDVEYSDLPVEYLSLDKGKSKATSLEPPQELANWAPSTSPAPPEEIINWALSSPSPPPKSPEKSVRFVGHEDSRNSPSTLIENSRSRILEATWAAEREAVARKAREVGTLTINSDEAEEDTLEAERIIADVWQAEEDARSEDSPRRKRGVGERTLLREREWQEEREEVKAKAKEVGAITIDTTREEEGDATGGTTTLLSQDTEAFEESLYQREQQQMQPPASGSLFTSSSTPYKRGSSSSRETASSRSSPPPVKGTSRWRGARGAASGTISAAAKTTADAGSKAKEKEREKGKTTRKSRRPVVEMEEVAEADEEANMLTEDLLTPPLPGDSASAPSETTPSENLPTPPASFITPAPAPAPAPVRATRRAARFSRMAAKPAPPPPRVGPVWEKRHWKLLDRLLHSSSTVPPPNSRLTYLVSIDDPAALDDDPEALLADPALTVSNMPTGEKALVLGGKEVEAVRRFMERMKVEGGEVERGWGVEMVAGKVGALVVAEVRRRRREEVGVRERGAGKGHGGGKGEEKGVGRVERGRRKGARLSDWL